MFDHIELPKESVQWMYHRQGYGWYAFSKMDSESLEEAYLIENKEIENRRDINIVQIDEGRYEVDIEQRSMTSTLWNEDSCRVVRGTWFAFVDKSTVVPLEECDSSILETGWKYLDWETKSPTSIIAIEDNVTKREVVVKSGWGSEKVAFSAYEMIKSKEEYSNISFKKLWRGFNEDEYLKFSKQSSGRKTSISNKAHPTHIAFVIHGIGEYFCKKKSFEAATIFDCAKNLRENARDILKDKLSEKKSPKNEKEKITEADELEDEEYIEFIPVDWTNAVRGGENLIDSVSLSTVPIARDLANDLLSDVLFYMAQKQQIIYYIVKNMNLSLKKFTQRYPSFNGSISILGHSLGSVIAYDLLSYQSDSFRNDKEAHYGQLLFHPDAFFAFGSPIGLFEAVHGKKIGMKNALPTCPRVFNVYHPSDPVAYRIEPLIHKSFQLKDAVRVPTFEGSDHLHYVINDIGENIQMGGKEFVAGVSKVARLLNVTNVFGGIKTTETTDKPQIQEQLDENETENPSICGNLNGGERVDYELQSTPLEHMNQLLSALWAHTSYWESLDFALFVTQQIKNLDESSRKSKKYMSSLFDQDMSQSECM